MKQIAVAPFGSLMHWGFWPMVGGDQEVSVSLLQLGMTVADL